MEINTYIYQSKKEMKGKNYEIVGEVVARGSKKKDVKRNGYYNRSSYKEVGYIQVDEGKYVIVVKRVIVKKVVSSVVAVALLAGGIYYFITRDTGPNIDPNIADYISDLKRPESLEDTKILIPGYGDFVIKEGEQVLEGILFNPEDNPCYFQYTIVEKDSGEALYESKLIPPGKGIENIVIEKELDKKSYEIVIRITTYDLNDYTSEFNGAEVKGKIIVVE